MTDTKRTRWRIASLTDLVEVVPTLLGFHPAESLVVVAVQGGEVIVTARADLPKHPGEVIAPALANLWRRFPEAWFLLLAFSDDPDRAWATLRAVDVALPPSTERTTIHVASQRWHAEPDDPGELYDGKASPHLARAAYEGRPVRRSRAELKALIEPARTPAEVEASIRRVEGRTTGWSDFVSQSRALLHAYDADPGELDLDDVTLLCLASHDRDFLAEAMLSTTLETAEVRQRLWLQVVRGCVPSCSGGALAALGLASWLRGEGALQVVCLEALAKVPGPPDWVDFLDAMNVAVVPPARWKEISAKIKADTPA